MLVRASRRGRCPPRHCAEPGISLSSPAFAHCACTLRRSAPCICLRGRGVAPEPRPDHWVRVHPSSDGQASCVLTQAVVFDAFAALYGRGRQRSGRCGRQAPGACSAARSRPTVGFCVPVGRSVCARLPCHLWLVSGVRTLSHVLGIGLVASPGLAGSAGGCPAGVPEPEAACGSCLWPPAIARSRASRHSGPFVYGY